MHSSQARNGSESADGEAGRSFEGESSVAASVAGLSEDEDVRAKHARFEKMRKQHYKMGAALKAHLVDT